MKNLKKRVLILGGYGNFGARIARMLSNEPDIQLIIAGRDKARADLLASQLPGLAEGMRLQRKAINLDRLLKTLHLDLLIHCAGPFQRQDYSVAHACLASGTPYIDIADDRRFVCDFGRLGNAAEAAGITMVSGASTLPALSSAVLAELEHEFKALNRADITIAPAHRIQRGLATTRAGFESLGVSFPVLKDGTWREAFAGGGLRRVELAHPVGERWVSDFDVPDLELWPRAKPQLQTVTFGTGVQPRTLQLGLSVCAHLSRRQLPVSSPTMAQLGHKLAAAWPGGSPNGGLKIRLEGIDEHGQPMIYHWQALGLNGDGPWIPAAPAAALARKMLRGQGPQAGAHACWQLLTLEEILSELTSHSVVTAVLRDTIEEKALRQAAASLA